MPILVAPRLPQFVPLDIDPTQVQWTSPAGKVTSLTNWQAYDYGIMVPPGLMGHLMPTFEFYSDKSPAFDGESIRGTPRAAPRNISVPLKIWGPDRATCKNLLHDLMSDLNPQNGIGTLTLTESGGDSRSIEGYYASGLEGEDDDDSTGRTWLSAVLVFRAPRPFWEGEAFSYTWKTATVGGTFFPVLPIAVQDSQVIGALVVLNAGNVRAFPIWTVKGPCTSIVLNNVTTGKNLTINKAHIAGDVSVIDTREGKKTAFLNGSTNLYEFITGPSSLWPLAPGPNNVQVTLAGSTSATELSMTYRAKYLAGM